MTYDLLLVLALTIWLGLWLRRDTGHLGVRRRPHRGSPRVTPAKATCDQGL